MPQADPRTDLAAAQAFTAAHRHPTPRATATWARSAPRGHPCCGIARDGWHCPRPGSVRLADGSRWCGHHSPAAVARTRNNRAWAQLQAHATAAHPHLVAALQEIAAGHPDPKGRALVALQDHAKDSTCN